jgi:hypothetical protein
MVAARKEEGFFLLSHLEKGEKCVFLVF